MSNGITPPERQKIVGFLVVKLAEYRRHELNSDQATQIAIEQEKRVFQTAKNPEQYDSAINMVINGIRKGVI
ncbi:unnamed protein product [Ambrosiozyma monospora]|uniref:Unnamed protein product n=1 Tax=Ambrosiozyma monospora TaxID=43982 RepID=A0ACB5U4Y4_AMBMO|nr:unnamed protein product [Ambrosiozyma monospora]